MQFSDEIRPLMPIAFVFGAAITVIVFIRFVLLVSMSFFSSMMLCCLPQGDGRVKLTASASQLSPHR
jgi:hypothetical protein